MNSPPKPVPAKPPAASANALPPVQAPNASFILQLFLIPMIIVLIIVSVWLMFSWLAHMGSDPHKIAGDIRSNNTASWQKALVLANMLRNPEYDRLKDDTQLAGELASLLQTRLKEKDSDEKAVQLRRYLCRAIGEFRVATGAPALIQAAQQEDAESDIAVRRSALASLAVLADNVGPDTLLEDPQFMQVLLAASQERGASPDAERLRAPIRSTAAYALGVVGGPEALDRLQRMLADSHADTRYNAANGLARHGDMRAAPVLIEMLSLENARATREEQSEAAKARKRYDVISNAIRVSERLIRKNPDQDFGELRSALRQVAESKLPGVPAIQASELLNQFDSKPSKVGS